MAYSQEQANQIKQSVINQIYQQINNLVGGGEQLFCMMFPGQPLNKHQYQYDTSQNTSILTRPWTVAEAEFRLSDNLFNLSPITQAPNGQKLSVVYETLINNYLPKLTDLAPFFKDRAGLGGFLLEDSGEVDEKNKKPLTRIELCKKLYKEYLDARTLWDGDKETQFKEFNGKNDLDGYARWQSTTAMSREAELDNLYNDVVVRGHLHEIMTILGYLNASSISEELEKAKQKMRHSKRISLDESMDVYPVEMQPSDWYRALEPNLAPEDLTMSQEVIADELRSKNNELSRLREQLHELELINVTPADVHALEKQVESDKKKYNDAENQIIAKYSKSMVMAVKTFLKGTMPELTAAQMAATLAEKKAKGKLTIDEKELKKMGLDNSIVPNYINMFREAANQMVDVYQEQQDVAQKAEKLTTMRAQLALAESKNMALQKLRLQEEIKNLMDDIENISNTMAGVYRQNNHYERTGLYKEEDNGLLKVETTTPGVAGGANPVNAIQTITIQSEVHSGTFTLELEGKTSGAINVENNDVSAFTTALDSLLPTTTTATTIAATHSVEHNEKIWTITFAGGAAGQPVPLLKLHGEPNLNDANNSPLDNPQNLIVIGTKQEGAGAGVSAIQTLTVDTTKVAKGTFKLKYGGDSTGDLDVADLAKASPAPKNTLTTALEGILGSGNVVVADVASSTTSWTITFQGDLANQPVTELEVIDAKGLEDSSGTSLELTSKLDKRPELPLLPRKRKISAEDAMFTDIVIDLSESEQRSAMTTTADSDQTSWNVGSFFASAGGQSHHSYAATDQEQAFFGKDMKIGFRVTKVSFDRGGWFNPQIFKMSHAFYRLIDVRAGAGVTKAQLNKVIKADPTTASEELHRLTTYIDDNGKTDVKYILPAYPVAMLVAKDITIRIKIDQSSSQALNEKMSDASSYSGGCLGFSASHASSSSDSSQSTYHGQHGQHYYIRVPGPQILGYVLELVDKDQADPYKPSFQNGQDSPFVDALRYFDLYSEQLLNGSGNGSAQQLAPIVRNGSGNALNSNTFAALSQSSRFAIVNPTNGSPVRAISAVGGVIHDSSAKVWIVVHTVGTSNYFVEGPASVKSNGEWSCNVSFGRAGTDSGKTFEIRAFANPSEELHSDRTLNKWPSADYSTSPVTVNRDSSVAIS